MPVIVVYVNKTELVQEVQLLHLWGGEPESAHEVSITQLSGLFRNETRKAEIQEHVFLKPLAPANVLRLDVSVDHLEMVHGLQVGSEVGQYF